MQVNHRRDMHPVNDRLCWMSSLFMGVDLASHGCHGLRSHVWALVSYGSGGTLVEILGDTSSHQ
jgi:hypothetical protein